MKNAFVPDDVTAQIDTFAAHGRYPVSRPGSRRPPTVVEAVAPIAKRIVSVLFVSAYRMKPTALAGAVAVDAVVPVRAVFAALPAEFTGAFVAIAA